MKNRKKLVITLIGVIVLGIGLFDLSNIYKKTTAILKKI